MKLTRPEALYKMGASLNQLDAFAKAITDFTSKQQAPKKAPQDAPKGKSRSKKKEETEE